ncbi:methyltransferase type 11 [Parachaetomium inaequale]|uniref:Methyltransferase type 11 n=1 Tax=Parachaetomium inaequale TaxID=2588326 RepID=A0AAN6SSI2_9PEZI|nr:methyltransferase type 11 [Parachaetomium inaequale]
MSDDPKAIVKETYDYLAEWYLRWVDGQPSPRERYATKVLQNARPASAPPHILELGCGPGVPVTRMLLDRGAQVTANDISTKQLALAKARCPQATLIPGDMTALSFEPASFDGVVSFFTIFHLPRVEQKGMLSNIYNWLKPGGIFVFNLATIDEEEIYGELMGHGMFWSSYSVEESEAMVTEVGLEVIEAEVLESEPDEGVKFMWVVARKGCGERGPSENTEAGAE